jgi:hypothetical protein
MVCGIIENLEASLEQSPYMSFLTNTIVIDVLDAWGMLLSKEWIDEMGGSVNQIFSYIIIPNVDGDPVVLYPKAPVIEQDGNSNGFPHQIHVVSEEID